MASGRSISGDIELVDTKVEGALEAGTISGTVRLRRVSARSLAINSVSGNVELEDVTAERVDAQVISGNITFAGDLQPNGRYELTSHSGNIRLAIPPRARLSDGGHARSADRSTPTSRSRCRAVSAGGAAVALRGTAGGGGAFLDLTTFSGTILITKR